MGFSGFTDGRSHHALEVHQILKTPPANTKKAWTDRGHRGIAFRQAQGQQAGGCRGAHQPLDDVVVAVSGGLDECLARGAFFSMVVKPPVAGQEQTREFGAFCSW